MLEKGHHGVRLDNLSRESRERLYCWIDLNVPLRGSFELPENKQHIAQRRCELNKALAGIEVDPEEEIRQVTEARKNAPPIVYEPPPNQPMNHPTHSAWMVFHSIQLLQLNIYAGHLKRC